MQNPAISVIIPLYNAEQFIGTCLDSLLIQTFQDFEVIVVDDCSTDGGVAIVESYADRFNGRLTLSSTKTNSGGGGYVPRNIGLGLSRGEYIYFVDADDFIVETALEILHEAVKTFDADVVYSSLHYAYTSDENFLTVTDGLGMRLNKSGEQDKPKMYRDDPIGNLQRLLIHDGLFHMPWAKFVERRLLVENEIRFPKIISGGDFIWTIQVLHSAKKLLRLPIALYFYRDDAQESVTRKKSEPQEQIARCFRAFMMGARELQNLSAKIDLGEDRPVFFHTALSPFLLNFLQRTKAARTQLGEQAVYEILAQECSDNPTVPLLLSVIDEQEKFFAFTPNS